MYGIDVYWSFIGTDGQLKVRKKAFDSSKKDTMYKIVVNQIDDKDRYESDGEYLRLDINKEYILGLDMSTSQSGVSIYDENCKLISMIDLVNDGLKAADLYRHLRAFFSRNFGKIKFKYVILEEQFLSEGGHMVFGKLSELQGNILAMSDIFKKIPERVKPQIWRKGFLADKRYNGRRQNKKLLKIATAEEVSNRFPEFMPYIEVMKRYSKSDQAYICDSCDSTGIVIGYMLENFKADHPTDRQYVSKTMKLEDKHDVTSTIIRFIPSTGKVIVKANPDYIESTIQERWGGAINKRGFKILMYNPDMGLEENMKRCTSITNNVILLLVEDTTAENQLQWQSKTVLDKEAGQMFAIVCYRTNYSKALNQVDIELF